MEKENQNTKNYHREIDFKVKNNGIYTYNKDFKDYLYLCRYIDVKRVLTNLITGDVTVELEYFHNGQMKLMTLCRSAFTKNRILSELPIKGIDVTDKNADAVLTYLLQREEQAQYINIHKQVGWAQIGEEKVFLLQNVVGSKIQSEYVGELNIKPNGTGKGWEGVIEREVLGKPPLELALTLGLSAPVTSRLRTLVGLDVLFFHIYGDSSIGKTTSLIVAMSPFGYPSKNTNGLIKTWMATDNAIIGYFKGAHGLPMALDEASTRSNSDYSNMIYQIADGKEKGRANINGETRKQGEWSGTIISTAENSILSKSNQNNGLRVRLIELGDIKWTTSAENSVNINSRLLENYGHAGVTFVEHLLGYSDEEIMKLFKDSRKVVMSRIKMTDSFTDRIADKITAIYMTAVIARKGLELNLDCDKILDILIDADAKHAEDRNIGEKAYEHIKAQIARNINKFIHKNDLATFNPNKGEYTEKIMPNGEIIGKIEDRSKSTEKVIILRDSFEKLLQEGNFTDSEIILRHWRDKELIETDNGKFTRKRSIEGLGKGLRTVVIKIRNEYGKQEEKESDNSAGKSPARKRPKIDKSDTSKGITNRLFNNEEEVKND